jgi:hypothetical protein
MWLTVQVKTSVQVGFESECCSPEMTASYPQSLALGKMHIFHHLSRAGYRRLLTICSVFQWVPYLTQNAWAEMLEDDHLLAGFHARNAKILGQHCEIAQAFLEEHKIPYYRNA